MQTDHKPLKRAFAPHLKHHVVFGRRRPKQLRQLTGKLKAKDFLKLDAIDVPASTNYRPAADAVLREMYGNDELGDCVPAGFAHVLGVETGNAGKLYTETLKQVISDYSAIGGYKPGHPETDAGCDEETALAFYCQHGFANGSRAAGWLALDPNNPKQIAAAMYLFENLIFGVGLPEAWISPFPETDGFVWDAAGDSIPENGHCFVGVDLVPNGIVIDTWAIEGVVTWKAIAKYCSGNQGGQLFVLITPDQIDKAKAKAPNGLDWAALVSAFDAMGGKVPVPAPQPPPLPVPPSPPPTPPAPAPAVTVTLAQAQQWAVDEIRRCRVPSMSKATAERLAKEGLAAHWPR
jgi:hypothetical protein